MNSTEKALTYFHLVSALAIAPATACTATDAPRAMEFGTNDVPVLAS